jgi:hypothetical protein
MLGRWPLGHLVPPPVQRARPSYERRRPHIDTPPQKVAPAVHDRRALAR